MILLMLVMAGCAYVAVRRFRTRTALAHAAPPPESRPMTFAPWGTLDDLQLTRLLRDAARGA